MKLRDLLDGFAEVPESLASLEATGLQDDSRLVVPGDLFVARAGHGDDGRRYASAALAAGAVAVLSEDGEGERAARCENVAAKMADLASRMWGLPSDDLSLWAVTGTNGKTTSTFLLESALRAAGRPCGLLGTVSNRVGAQAVRARLTTPGMLDFHRFAASVRDEGIRDLVFEASSHALDQGRLGNLRVRAAAFTNLTQDHLDYHGDMESYFRAKKRLFSDFLVPGGRAVVNVDNAYGARLADELGKTAWRVSRVDKNADVALVEDRSSGFLQRMTVRTPAGTLRIESGLPGAFNQENLLGAAGWAVAAGVPLGAIEEGFASVRVPGRMQVVCDGPATVVVDYAHTPDAVERVLRGLRPNVRGRLVVLFGCGGDRDRTKRPKMAAAAARLADRVVLTSDNPRHEDPLAILADVRAGIPAGTDFVEEPDRRKAIALAVSELREGDALLLAGKGHEDYQIFGDEKVPFDDAVEARRAWEERRWN